MVEIGRPDRVGLRSTQPRLIAQASPSASWMTALRGGSARVAKFSDADEIRPLLSGARFWKTASSVIPLTNRLRIIGLPATFPEARARATDR